MACLRTRSERKLKNMVTLSRRTFIAQGIAGGIAFHAWAQGGYPPAGLVTDASGHYFFGYYDKCPWDITGRYLLAGRADFIGREPKPGEELILGAVDLTAGRLFRPVSRTAAWCWQQGAMLRWLPSAPDRKVIYNVLRENRWASEIADILTGRKRVLPFPIYNVNLQNEL